MTADAPPSRPNHGDEDSRRSARVYWGFVSLLTGCLSLLLIGAVAAGVWRSRSSTSWSQTEGRVLRSDVRRGAGRPGSSYVEIKYGYTVADKHYVGEHVYAGSTRFLQWEELGVVERYHEGAAASVFYDPADPRRACLEPGLRGVPYPIILVGIIFGLCGAYSAWACATGRGVPRKEDRAAEDYSIYRRGG